MFSYYRLFIYWARCKVLMMLTIRFFFRLIKRLWTRFGDSIRHENVVVTRISLFLSCRNVLHTQPHTRALFKQKEFLKYLFIFPPRLCLSMHNLCNYRPFYSLYSLSVSNSISFPSVLFLRNAANHHRSTLLPPFILVDKHIVYSSL